MKRIIAALALGVLVFAGVLAFAANLTVSSASLGAGSNTVSSCAASTVNVSYPTPTYSSTAPGYTVGSATVTLAASDATACAGKTIGLTLVNSSNASLGNGTAAIPASSPPTSYTITLSSSALASAVANAHVVIS
jgi:hypothetical protein